MSSAPPSWVADAVFYQIFPDRFARSGRAEQPPGLEDWDTAPTTHGYKGGDLYGVADRLDWIEELGASALYLNPIFQSACNHRYHPYDYHRVDPLLGGDAAFDQLLAACRKRGLRLVLDGVFNHASRGFFPFHDVLENGSASPWRDWFTIERWPVRAYGRRRARDYTAWQGLPALPKLNTDHPEVREFIMGVGEHWTRKGIDGWRLDVPTEITTPGFWEEFRQRVRAINPECWIVGEIWHDASEWVNRGDRFDGTMNYLLTEAILRFVLGDRIRHEVVAQCGYRVDKALDAAGFGAALRRLSRRYTPAALRANLNLLGSHDTPRMFTVANEDQESTTLLYLLLFAFPGAPCIYYGDEIGLRGGHDPDCRATFPWHDPQRWNRRVLAELRSLTRLRKKLKALRSACVSILRSNTEMVHLALHGCDSEGFALVAVNAGQDRAHVSLAGDTRDRIAGDLKFGAGRIAGEGLELSPRSGSIWV